MIKGTLTPFILFEMTILEDNVMIQISYTNAYQRARNKKLVIFESIN